MTRRLPAVLLLAVAALLLSVGVAAAGPALDVPRGLSPTTAEAAAATTTTTVVTDETTESLPGTTLEAEQRDDGTTSMAPWLIGSGLAAAAVVGLGGLFLKHRAG